MIDDMSPRGDRQPRGAPMFHRILAAEPLTVQQALIDLRVRFAGTVPPDAVDRMELALAEVLNNIVQHGRPPRTPGRASGGRPPVTIHLTVISHAGGLACAVADDGTPLPQSCLVPVPPPSPELAALREGGFGWFMIRDLTQALFYFREHRRNVLCFHIPPAEDRRRPSGTAVVA